MADIERAKQALLNAHNAGDVEAAQKIATYIKEQQNQAPVQKTDEPKMSAGNAALTGALQGATFGFGDEIMARIGSLAPDLTYDEIMAAAKEDIAKARKDRPAASITGELAGGLATGVAGGLTKAGSALASSLGRGGIIPRIAKSAGVGATSGAVYGAGTAEQGQRLPGAGSGAIVGGVVGGAIPAVAGAVGKSINSVRDMFARKVIDKTIEDIPVPEDISKKAMKKVVERLRADFPDENDFQDALNKFTYGKKSIAEVSGERVTNLGKGAAQYPSGEAITKELFLPRVFDSPERVKGAVGRFVSKNDDYYKTLDEILETGRKQAAPLYRDAFSKNRVVQSKEIDKILATPAGKKALNDARIIMQNDRELMGLPNKELGDLAREMQQMGMMAETPGGVAAGLKLRTLDYVKKALDDQYEEAVRAGAKSNSKAILGLKQSLVSELDQNDVTGLYRKARETAGDYLSAEKSMELGTGFKKIDAPLIEREFKKMSPAEKTAFKTGVVKSLRDDIDNITEGGNIYMRVFGKPARQKQLQTIIGKEKYKELEKSLLGEDKIFKIRNEVLSNSSTASKQKAAEEFQSIAEGYAQDLATVGNTTGIINAAARTTKTLITKMFDGISDKTAGEVARILYTTDKAEKLKIINLLRKTALTSSDVQKAKEANKALNAFFVFSDQVKKAKSKTFELNVAASSLANE